MALLISLSKLRDELCKLPAYVATQTNYGGEPTSHGLAFRREDVSDLLNRLAVEELTTAVACPNCGCDYETAADLREWKDRETTATIRRARIADAAEMLWVTLANVSGSDWSKQSPEWQAAAARWRDNYFEAIGLPR